MNSAFKSKNIFTNLKYAYQRIKRGYCDANLWEIDGWFLTVVPDMLKQYNKTRKGYPEILRRKYYEKNKNTLNIPYEKFICDCGEKAGEAFDREWTEIINQMSEGFETLIPLRGNHDYLACHLLKKLCFNADISFAENITDKFNMWLYDGGAPTYDAFTALTPEEQNKIIAYLNTFLIYDEVQCGENDFLLAHTVPEKKRMEQFNKLLWQEFITGEPEYEKEYFPNKYIVTGHTPTGFIDKAYKGRIYRKNNHIAIDCGEVFGNPLGCICLDTFEEFYTK